MLHDLVQEVDDPGKGVPGTSVVLQAEVGGVCYTLTRHVPRPRETEVPALSSREREIARMIAKGYTNKTIALVLEISSWTVDTHIRRIFGKLGVRSRSAMVARLAAAGVVASERQPDGEEATPEWQEAWVQRSAAR